MASPPPQQKKDQPSQARLYSPYQDLNLPYATLYNLPTNPDHLFPEDSTRTRRTWGENLTYYTGLFYLGGALYGSAKGTLTGIRAFEEGDTRKLKINRVLNGAGEGGRGVGNRMGVIGLIYAGLESGVVAVRDVDDVVNGVIAGLGTGVVYRAANGVRAAAVAGAVGGVVAGVAMAGKRALKRYVPI